MSITLHCPMVHHQGGELTRFQHSWNLKNFMAPLQCFSPPVLFFMLDNVCKNECIIYLVQNLHTKSIWVYQCCLFLSLSLHFNSENQELPVKDIILYIKNMDALKVTRNIQTIDFFTNRHPEIFFPFMLVGKES